MSAQTNQGSFVDRLSLDLATARLLHVPLPGVIDRVRAELIAVRDALVHAFPESAVLLTGSLFANEGQAEVIGGHPVLRSDYDFFVVSPSAPGMWPSVARRRLASTLELMPLSAQLDIGLIWEPMLRTRKTTIGGAVVGGTLDLASTLPGLPAPHAGSAILRAYRLLTAAPLYPERYGLLCAKSLMRAAHALLLHEVKDRPRKDWIGLFSVAFVRDAIAHARLKCRSRCGGGDPARV